MIYGRPENGWETRNSADGSGVKDLESDALNEYWLCYCGPFSGCFACHSFVRWTSDAMRVMVMAYYG